jgi:hypothetical protein
LISVALLGLGYWGGNYLRGLQNICDSNPEALKDVPSNVKATLEYKK